ncbi:MAG: adenylyltransferase/cytidyltransferase family protein [Candidatus Roizmanbacteria bacterium]|nr:adenylyltransferase/cytidyltransferase family protein [Candidatus Roizmanbacteria bacterium]
MRSKIIEDRAFIVNLVYNFQSIGKVVVLVHGTFDILRPRHIELLKKAKELGDVLIVGVYADEIVKAIKGPQRPLVTLSDRMTVLDGLSDINFIIPLQHPEHEQIVSQLKPNIFIHQANSPYHLDTSYLEKYKGTIRSIEVTSEDSTTALIQRIQGTSQNETR